MKSKIDINARDLYDIYQRFLMKQTSEKSRKCRSFAMYIEVEDYVTFKDIRITRRDILEAIDKYNRKYPNNEYKVQGSSITWLEDKTYENALLHEDRKYPPIIILSLATGFDAKKCLDYKKTFRDLGFTIVPKAYPDPSAVEAWLRDEQGYELSPQEIARQITHYERVFNMDSETFLQKRNDGTIPDTFETMDWMILLRHKENSS